MAWLATVVALALAALLPVCLRTCGSKSLISLALLLAPFVRLVLCTPVPQAFCLLTDVTDEHVGVSGGGPIKACGRKELGHELGQLFWDTVEDCVLIVFVGDCNTSCCELFVLVGEVGKECPDVKFLELKVQHARVVWQRTCP